MAKDNAMIRDMTTGSIWRCLLVFGLPFMGAQLLQTAYNLVDMVIVGQFVGSTGLSAVSVGGDLLMLLTNLCMGFAVGGQVMIAQYVGKRERENISRTVGTLSTLLLILGLALTLACLCLSRQILTWLHVPQESWEQARAYSTVCYLGLLPIFGYNAVSAVLRGMGDSHHPLLFVAIAAGLNLVLDLLFVAVFHMQALGAALATVLGQTVSFVCSVGYLYRRRESFGFDFRPASFKPDPGKLKTLLKLGVPQAIQYGSVAISTLYVSSHLNAYGVTVSAVHGVGGKLTNLVFMVTGAVSAACSAIVGQNLGAQKPDRVKKAVHYALVLNACWILPVLLLFNLFPQAFFRLFTSDADILSWAATYMRMLLVSIVGFIAMGPYYAVASGLGFASFNLIVGLLDAFVGRIGFSYLLGSVLGLGVVGYWTGSYSSVYITVIICAIYFYSGKWKTHKLLD